MKIDWKTDWKELTTDPQDGDLPFEFTTEDIRPQTVFDLVHQAYERGWRAGCRREGFVDRGRGVYRIVRFYGSGKKPHQVRGRKFLTEEEARAHCNDPETSSSTCTLAKLKARTRKYGHWFDAWTEMR